MKDPRNNYLYRTRDFRNFNASEDRVCFHVFIKISDARALRDFFRRTHSNYSERGKKKTIRPFHEKARLYLLDGRARIIERCSSKGEKKKKNPCANSSDNDSLGMRRQSDSVCPQRRRVLSCLRADGLTSAGCHARRMNLL